MARRWLPFFGARGRTDPTSASAGLHKASPFTFPYRGRRSVLSGPELDFYQALKDAVAGDYVILLKVGLLELCEITSQEVNTGAVDQLASKHVDFVLCDPSTLAPVVAIELDDSRHYGRERAEREGFIDEFFRVIGVALIRQRVQPSYDRGGLASWVHAAALRSRPHVPTEPLRPAS